MVNATHLGLDVYKETIAVAVLRAGETEPDQCTIPNTPEAIRKLVGRLGGPTRIEEAVSIWRRLGERLQLAFDLIWLAFAYGRAARWQSAHQAAVEALSIFREVDNATGIALAFRDLAFLAVWESRPHDALRFAGAAESLREKIGGGPPPGFGGMLEGDPAEEARSRLGDAEAERSWQEGRDLDVDAALAIARRSIGE
jgi:hypothetical protein